jgi:hypothetical protein
VDRAVRVFLRVGARSADFQLFLQLGFVENVFQPVRNNWGSGFPGFGVDFRHVKRLYDKAFGKQELEERTAARLRRFDFRFASLFQRGAAGFEQPAFAGGNRNSAFGFGGVEVQRD